MMAATELRLDHLARMSDGRGLFEHAEGTVRRPENGYCTDDNARLLVLMSRSPATEATAPLSRLALRFVLDAQVTDGRVRNRMNVAGKWTDHPSCDDCWGRSVWALGTASALHPDATIRRAALTAFDAGARQRSRWPRAMAFAALGAAEVLGSHRQHRLARALLIDTAATIGPTSRGAWEWPEPTLTYANATLAEAVIVAGAGLGNGVLRERGLQMLRWLLAQETVDGHLSVTGADGRGPGDRSPQFDQQPIEVAAMADACWRAMTITGNPSWRRGIDMAAAWFHGDNDCGLTMFDVDSGGGYDGLQPDSVNLNQGAESTLAWLSTMQRATVPE
jgi:hypothetical protein